MLFNTILSSVLAAHVVVAAPQHINFAALNPVIDHGKVIPFDVTAQVVKYNPTAARNAAVAAVTKAPKGAVMASKRSDVERRTSSDCGALPAALYTGPFPTTDTPAAFLAFAAFGSAALSAPVPPGYTQSFTNLQASNNALGYMGFTELTTYDVTSCAAKCSATVGCLAINIYFERDPTINPAAGCPNPSSETVVKCVFWGGEVTAGNCVNTGQNRNDFHVVIAGSNGYNVQSMPSAPPAVYGSPISLGSASINAPLDCNGVDTFLGSRLFTGSPFDPSVCAASCTATSEYDIAHAGNSAPKTCQFFNTYILYLNGVAQGQACAMYTESWAKSYATNTGYTSGSNVYTIGSSYTYSNTTNPAYASACTPSNTQSPTTQAAATKSTGTTTSSPVSATSSAPAIINGYVSQGCYRDQPVRALNGPGHASSTMTLEFCSNYCQGFTYFGVEDHGECYCGNTIDGGSAPISNSECSYSCTGNDKETCGGFWAINIYKNPNKGPRPLINGVYGWQGCYNDAIVARGPLKSTSSNTWEACATYCDGYPYFYVENSNACGCTNTLLSSALNPGGCHAYPCTGNSSESCGAFGSMDVYASPTAVVALPKPVNNFQYLGCYPDSQDRILGWNSPILGDNGMTVEKCTSHCATAGFAYAGVEFGVECFCGNTIAPAAHMVADTTGSCGYHCAGNSGERCGGFYFISVWAAVA